MFVYLVQKNNFKLIIYFFGTGDLKKERGYGR